jgi:putative ABC transport system ATP-binding protein
MIRCTGLVKIYKVADIEVVALQGLDLTVGEAETIGIMGPSGSGKTTLMNVLGGLDVPSAGQASVAGIELVQLSDRERLRYRRRTVGFVWQNTSRNLVPYLSAVENVELAMMVAGRLDRPRAQQLLDVVGLHQRRLARPRAMSTGEQQRVAVAIALANAPRVLLADEPTGSLDTENTERLLELFDSVRRELHVTVVVVTHDPRVAGALDRYVAIRDGKTATGVGPGHRGSHRQPRALRVIGLCGPPASARGTAYSLWHSRAGAAPRGRRSARHTCQVSEPVAPHAAPRAQSSDTLERTDL